FFVAWAGLRCSLAAASLSAGCRWSPVSHRRYPTCPPELPVADGGDHAPSCSLHLRANLASPRRTLRVGGSVRTGWHSIFPASDARGLGEAYRMAEFDPKRVSNLDWVVIGAGALAFISSFLPWYRASVSFSGISRSASTGAWSAGFAAWFS